MTRILALDASTEVCSVALFGPGINLSRSSQEPRTHSQKLLPLVDEILQARQLSAHSLDAVAYSAGPGSFTGLRIAFGCAQGLAFGAGLPMVGISSLEAMAFTASESEANQGNAIACLLDARMGELYWAVYSNRSGTLQCLSEPQLSSPEDTVAGLYRIQSTHERSLVLAGPAVNLLPNDCCRNFPILGAVRPSAQAIAALAAQRFSLGQAVSADQAQLFYLRDSVSWNKRQRIRSLPDSSY